MLNSSQKKEIRRIKIHDYSFYEKNGQAITHKGQKFNVLGFTQLKKAVFEEILALGFTNIQVVSPRKANCIIRLYQKLHYHYEGSMVYNLYGAECYTLEHFKWVTKEIGKGNREINYSKHLITHIIKEDESINFDCEFFDCYVRVS